MHISDCYEVEDRCWIYAADLYCDACGRALLEDLKDHPAARELREAGWDGNADTLYRYEYDCPYDSDDFPKGPYPTSESVDCPHFCGAGEGCLKAVNGVPALLGYSLTDHGVEYVRELIEDAGFDLDGERPELVEEVSRSQLYAAILWEFYSDEIYY